MKRPGRNSFIGGIVALSLVLAGTGYAYWTDSLNVTTKATTGDFGVQFVDLGLYAQYTNETLQGGGWSIVDGIGDDGYVADNFFMRGAGAENYNKIAKDGSIDAYKKRAEGYNNVDFNAKLVDPSVIKKDVGPYVQAINTNASGQIEITIDKMYPGYAQAFRSDIVNVGDIAAKLSNIKFKVTDLDGQDKGNVDHMIGVAVYIDREQYKPKGKVDEPTFKLADAIGKNNTFTVGKVDFVRLSALSDKDVKDALEKNVIKCAPATDQRLDIFIGVAMDPDAEGKYTTGTSENRVVSNDDGKSQSKGIKLSMDLLWDQFNIGKDAGKGNMLKEQNATK
ncbi:MAG: SipW-dependent-type signal peptide-containing protein [Peptoanaerobacter stomatis]|uniref:SipW-dependent-type signal peptide-containing protein n=1 Tax=Peptoanaerobacter stomatis TaxID=796937 RepID=UPI003FA17C04